MWRYEASTPSASLWPRRGRVIGAAAGIGSAEGAEGVTENEEEEEDGEEEGDASGTPRESMREDHEKGKGRDSDSDDDADAASVEVALPVAPAVPSDDEEEEDEDNGGSRSSGTMGCSMTGEDAGYGKCAHSTLSKKPGIGAASSASINSSRNECKYSSTGCDSVTAESLSMKAAG